MIFLSLNSTILVEEQSLVMGHLGQNPIFPIWEQNGPLKMAPSGRYLTTSLQKYLFDYGKSGPLKSLSLIGSQPLFIPGSR